MQTFVRIYSRPSLTWDDLPFLRDRTELPIVLKGILHPDDARRAVDEGMNGIWVSNHGGRQVDGATSTIAALPGDRRRGRRPHPDRHGQRHPHRRRRLQGAGTGRNRGRHRQALLLRPGDGRREGVREVLDNFRSDFDLTMGLAGCKSVSEIGPEALVRA